MIALEHPAAWRRVEVNWCKLAVSSPAYLWEEEGDCAVRVRGGGPIAGGEGGDDPLGEAENAA